MSYNTGSSLLDEIVARRAEIKSKLRQPRRLTHGCKPTKLPMVRLSAEKPVAERIAEAMRLRGKIPNWELYRIINTIRDSALDGGEKYFLDMRTLECAPEIVPPGELTVASIQEVVAKHFGVTIVEILSNDRHRRAVLARHIAMYLAKKAMAKSYSEIARRFGVDHAAVIHAVRKIGGMIERDEVFAREVEAIKGRLSS